MSPVVAYGLAYGAVVAMVLTAARLAPALPGRRVTIVAAVAIGLLALVAGTRADGTIAAVVVAVALLGGGATIGAALGSGVMHPGHLLPVAVVSSLADLWSVLHAAGPSAAAARSPRLLSLIAVSFPVAGVGIAPILGVGDIVFAALYVSAARRHALGIGRMTGALAGGFVATLVALVVLQRPLPALPLLGAAVVLAIPAARRVPEGDRALVWTVIAACVVVGVVLLLR